MGDYSQDGYGLANAPSGDAAHDTPGNLGVRGTEFEDGTVPDVREGGLTVGEVIEQN